MGKYDITYATLTNKGMRSVNEDYLDICERPERIGFILCDGLGGHGNGDIASKYVTEEVKKQLETGASLEDCIYRAQVGLLRKQRAENAGDSMKTTIVCLTISDRAARFGHVGDSRIYRFDNYKYISRTQDHSVPQMLANRGEIKDSEIRHHEDRSRLLRVMGTEWNGMKYEVEDAFLVNGFTSFLLCSDGFWELIDEKTMCKLLKNAESPEQWLEQMEGVVKENGAGTDMDNYSAIAVFVRCKEGQKEKK